ncbi:lantibiotic dehydratase [Streptomyces sp. KCTC 0041BP]|uniref:lantibiotic dehydratase n=1 Tax=Streptomyces sp. KCTC 0041BP TaxID=201500 RepID=UPI001AE9E29C|nr:lantibiotic dehydratase [Streptomyces sp. KCTC 0041BP]MBP0935372.1 lantibiotic dehydratase [Streptomyces sp. KCTC 0041BP]
MQRYHALDFHLLRAPALPVGVWRDALDGADRERTRARLLRALADDPRVRHGLVAAGSGLLDGLAKLDGAAPGSGSGSGSGKEARRVHSRALRYLTRMSTRPTPFGAFSGVALGTFGDTTTARLGATALGEAHVRADTAWLLALVQRLEEDPQSLARLGVSVNAMAHRVGDRLVLPSSGVHGDASDRRAVRVRHTAPLARIRALAPPAAPVPYATLVTELAEEFPAAGRERISAFVAELVGLGLLVTDLRPPVTEPRPEAYVLDRLTAAGVDHPAVAALREIVGLTGRAPYGDTDALRRLRAAQRALVPLHKGQPSQVDSALDLAAPALNRQIAAEVAEAVGCLAELGRAAPAGYDHLGAYHQAFMERYGSDALVPVLDLLGAERGLDAPGGYLTPPRAMALNQHVAEDDPHTARALVALAADAWRRGAGEVELTDEVLRRLLPPDAANAADAADSAGLSGRPDCPGLDAYVQIAADGPEAIDRGEWRAVLNPDGLGEGGRTFGRFGHLLGADATDRLRAYARAREALEPDVVVAELAYLPANGRGANVAIRPAVHAYEIPVNVAPTAAPEQVIDLADIHVGAADEGLRLYSARLGRELVVVQNHMLSPYGAPNVCRFLLEVSRARYATPAGFGWGPVEGAPHLPRVVRGRVVVRAAEWNLYPAGAQAAPAAGGPVPVPRSADEVARWRRDWGVPRYVYLADDDNRLLLDLDHPLCVDELLAELGGGAGSGSGSGSGRVTLHEALPGPDSAWLRDGSGRGHLSEVVIPLIATGAREAAREIPRESGPGLAPEEIRRKAAPSAHPAHLPGSAWSYLKLYAARDLHDEIAATELPSLLPQLREAGADPDRWFYIRYADPDAHLRIRVRTATPAEAPAAAPGTALPALLAWGEGLVRRGLAERLEVATYHPEISRYGGPAVHDAVEELFAANSDVSCRLLRLLWDEEEPGLEPEAVVIAAVDALYAQWGLGIRERLAAMPRPAQDAEARERYRKDRDYLCELLQPWERRPHPLGRAHHERLAAVLDAQAPAVRRAALAVARAEAAGTLWGGRDAILASLAHMQVNRLLPMDRPAENRCYLVWGHVLNCLRGRPQ